MKIKVCCIDEDGRYGGPQSRMIDVYKNLNFNKFNCEFILPPNMKIFKKKLKKIDAKFYEIDITRLSSDFFLFLKYVIFLPLEILILIKFFKEKKYDLIQVNGVPHFKSAIAAKLTNIPMVWVIEDSYSPKIIVSIFKMIVKFCDAKIIYLSQKVYNFYLKDTDIKRNNLYKIMSPTNAEYYKKKKFKIKKQLNICSVSGIIKVKDPETFLNVAKEVISKHENVNFLFVGRGTKSESSYNKKIKNIYDSLDTKFKKKIIFLGMKLDIKKILQESDIFLCTSKSEGGPIAVWEAMSMSLPVVTTKVGGTIEYIKDSYSGYLCNLGDYKGISQNISKLINSFKLRKKFGIRSRKIVERFLDSKVISKKYQKVYESVFKRL